MKQKQGKAMTRTTNIIKKTATRKPIEPKQGKAKTRTRKTK